MRKLSFLLLIAAASMLLSSSKSVSKLEGSIFADCNYYTYDLGFNHAKNVRRQCDLSPTILQNTYTLNMSNPCFQFRVGFQEGWFAYQSYCSTGGGGNNGGGTGGGGNGDGPGPIGPGGPPQQ
ncbi:hypothetical protein [Ekhidna sp.]